MIAAMYVPFLSRDRTTRKLIDIFRFSGARDLGKSLELDVYMLVARQSDSKSRQMSKSILWSSVKRLFRDKGLEAENRDDPRVGEISGDPITSLYRSAVEPTFHSRTKRKIYSFSFTSQEYFLVFFTRYI